MRCFALLVQRSERPYVPLCSPYQRHMRLSYSCLYPSLASAFVRAPCLFPGQQSSTHTPSRPQDQSVRALLHSRRPPTTSTKGRVPMVYWLGGITVKFIRQSTLPHCPKEGRGRKSLQTPPGPRCPEIGGRGLQGSCPAGIGGEGLYKTSSKHGSFWLNRCSA